MRAPPKNPLGHVGRHVRARILSGLLVLIPVVITFLVLNLLFGWFSGFLTPLLKPFGRWVPPQILPFIAVIATIALIYLTGVVVTLVVGRRLFEFAEAVLLRVPLVKSVYSASKQIVETFSGTNRQAFKAVVAIEFPRPGCLALAFVTGTMRDANGRELYRVFLPTTPNPTSGFLLLLPSDQVQQTDISVENGIKMVVSGGVLSPDTFTSVVAK